MTNLSEAEALEKKLLEDLLHPPPFQPTEEQHRIAYLTKCLSRITDFLLDIKMIRDGTATHSAGKLITDKDAEAEKELTYLLDSVFVGCACGKIDECDLECWEHYIDYDKFKRTYNRFLSDGHWGDCVSQACSCTRCVAEELYKVPSTQKWKSSEGYRMSQRLKDLEDKIK